MSVLNVLRWTGRATRVGSGREWMLAAFLAPDARRKAQGARQTGPAGQALVRGTRLQPS